MYSKLQNQKRIKETQWTHNWGSHQSLRLISNVLSWEGLLIHVGVNRNEPQGLIFSGKLSKSY